MAIYALLQNGDDLLLTLSRAFHRGSPLQGLGELTLYMDQFSGVGQPETSVPSPP